MTPNKRQQAEAILDSLDLFDYENSITQLRPHFSTLGEEIFNVCYDRIFNHGKNEMFVAAFLGICAEINQSELFDRIKTTWSEYDVYVKGSIKLCARDQGTLTVKQWLALFNHPDSVIHDRRSIFANLLVGANQAEFEPYIEEYFDIVKKENLDNTDFQNWLQIAAKDYNLKFANSPHKTLWNRLTQLLKR